MEFTGSSARIGISLPADMLEYLLQRKRQEGIPVSVQIQRAIETDIMDRAEANQSPAPARTPEEIDEFLYGPQRRAAANKLVDPGEPYNAQGGE